MRAMIVDDERLARSALRRLLTAHPEVEVIGEAANPEEALQAIRRIPPDILFLDVEMPGGSGFDLLEKLDEVPAVIFTTAYDEYAVHAFEVGALDYLVKPVAAERLTAALGRARRALSTTSRQPADTRLPSALQRIFVRSGDRCWIVSLNEISLIEAAGNYSRLHFSGNAPLVFRSLAAIEQRLDPATFFRANRSQIVNLGCIAAVEEDIDGRLVIRLRDGTQVGISRRQSRSLRELLSL